jgi:thiosulfate/3-mercaptopyruvate sulfurtransferase
MTQLKTTTSLICINLLIILITGCSNFAVPPNSETTIPPMDSLVSSDWLSQNLDQQDLVVLDSTVIVKMDKQGGMSNISGYAQYQQGHIPGARFADLKGAMSSHDSSLDFVMPSPQQFAATIGELGIDNNSRVVIYSSDNHVWAARLWWMLRWAGLDQVAILDGGLKAWAAEGRAVTDEEPEFPKKKFVLALRPELIADRNQVFNAIDNPQVSIVDALPAASYSGKFSMYARPGHIPTATNMPTSVLVNETGHYKSFDELDMMQDGDRKQKVITYCGGGVAASGAAFILHRLGFENVAVYMGSLQEWAENPENPMTIDVTE